MQTIYDWRSGIDDVATRRQTSFPDVVDPVFWEMYDIAKRYSMLHVTGFLNLYNSMRYIGRHVEGDIVECGTFLGGASIFIGLCMERFGFKRQLWMLDTYAGFPPGQTDSRRGIEAKGPRYRSYLKAVKQNVATSLSSTDHIHFVEGDVEQTIPKLKVDKLSMLRLDTDFYVSTKVELDHLYPKLASGGVLIIDDYGVYDGSRRATDEYLDALGNPILLNRIDGGVWTGIKP